MTTLHAFGCSITQGFALPDIVRPLVNDYGRPLTATEIQRLGDRFSWESVHILAPSVHAWPEVLARSLGYSVVNHARRGACFHQIARQIVTARSSIREGDVVMVAWTYMSRLSLQWPARTAVPYGTLADPRLNWQTVILGFNRMFGISSSDRATTRSDQSLQQWIESSTKYTHLDPRAMFDRYYNNLVLQITVDGLLRSTGARVIHLSVEPESGPAQLERLRRELDPDLGHDYTSIARPDEWYTLDIDHDSALILLDPSIPPAENDTHPSVEHHRRFAVHLEDRYFKDLAA